MTAEPLRLDPGGALRLAGRLTFETAAELCARVDTVVGPGGWGPAPVTFDLGAVQQADSAGLALLVRWRRQAARAGGQACFRSVPASLRAIARLSGVEEHLFDPGR